MKDSTIKNALLEIITAETIEKDNLMAEMNEAILGAMGTFVAISKGILTTESNPVTGEPLTQIAKEQAEELRKIFDKYIEIDRERMLNEAKKILNDIVISGKRLTLDQQQQLLDVVLGLGGLATRTVAIKGGK